MSSTVTLIIVLSVIGIVVAAIAGYFYLRFTRGSIRLSLPGSAYNPGDPIAGGFTMTTKKPIEGKRLFVAVVGKEVIEERDHDRNSTRTRTREIYRDEQAVEDARTYPAGYTKDYNFQLTAPAVDESGSLGMGGALGQTVQFGLELLSGRDRRLEWRVEARLDANGIDLSASQRIYLNTGQM